VSERRACAVVGQPRATQRYEPREPDDEKPLVRRMKELSAEHPRYGYRRVWALLRAEKFRVNRKRVHRLWRREGLRVPRKQRKRRRLGNGGNSCTRRKALHPDHVWSYDFVMDQTSDGRRLKLLPVVDEFTRECLAIEVERHFTAADVVATLKYLFELRGAPRFIRSDNGPEFIADAVKAWLERSGCGTLYIEPGSPSRGSRLIPLLWENAYVESFNGKLEDELLNREQFATLEEAKVLVEDHRLDHNHRRPHSALGYLTPAAFAASHTKKAKKECREYTACGGGTPLRKTPRPSRRCLLAGEQGSAGNSHSAWYEEWGQVRGGGGGGGGVRARNNSKNAVAPAVLLFVFARAREHDDDYDYDYVGYCSSIEDSKARPSGLGPPDDYRHHRRRTELR